jgi:hypothetical protein
MKIDTRYQCVGVSGTDICERRRSAKAKTTYDITDALGTRKLVLGQPEWIELTCKSFQLF